MDTITIMNSIAQSISLTLMISFYEEKGVWRKILAYLFFGIIIDLSLNFFIPKVSYLSLHCIGLTFLILLNMKLHNLTLSLLNVLKVLILFMISVLLLWNLLVFFFPYQLNQTSFSYNYFFSVMIILVSCFFRFYKDGLILNIRPKKDNSVEFADFILFGYFLFFTLIMPCVLSHLDILNYAIVVFVFVCNIIILLLSLYYIGYLELQNHIKDTREKFHEMEKEKLDEVIKLKHYFLNLFKYCIKYALNDEKEKFLVSVQKYINPLYEGLVKEDSNLDNLKFIENELIRDLFYQYAASIVTYPNIQFLIDIRSYVIEFSMKEMDLYKILSVYLDNAKKAVMRHKKGFIAVIIQNNITSLIFEIKNSFEPNDEICKSDLRSFNMGLQIMMEVIAGYENVDIETIISDDVYTAKLIIERILK